MTRVRGGTVDRYVGVYEHQLLPNDDEDMPWLIGRRRVLIDHSLSPVELIIFNDPTLS